MLHGISIDVEDWYQSTFDPSAPLSDRFITSTRTILEAFGEAGVKGTFFVLGLAAEKKPEIVKEIMDAGHEIQSHGYGHVEVFKLSEEEFRQDLIRAKKLLEDMTGQEIYGYRAPSFSIDERTPWAHDVLAETGHRYDSSIFPIKMRRYGVADYPMDAQIVSTSKGNRIVEAPIAALNFGKKRFPIGGGGYFRLLPYFLIRAAYRRLDAKQRSGVIYFHPYEYDPSEAQAYKNKVSPFMRLHQGLGRKSFAGKIRRFIRDFSVAPIRDVVSEQLKQLD